MPIVLRGIVGRGWGQGATHSQSLQATFAHFPGLYVATPATPADAKGLLVSALQGTGPVVLLENRALYELEGEVPEGLEPVPFGKGAVTRPGKDITIVGVSLMAYEALRAAEHPRRAGHGRGGHRPPQHPARSTTRSSSGRSGKRAAWSSPTRAGRSAACPPRWRRWPAEKAFPYLKAPVRRVTPPDSPAPVSRPLEDAFHPNPLTIARACLEVLKAGSSAEKGVADVQATFAGPY